MREKVKMLESALNAQRDIIARHIDKPVETIPQAFTPYKDTLVSELSQGNRQKLTLILALVQKPKVLCLDEPTNGLDPNQILDVRHLICSSPSSQHFHHQS